jgi:hypothetical protein
LEVQIMFVPDKREAGRGCNRAGRLFQILTMLQDRSFAAQDGQWLTSTEVARAMGLAPSLHVRLMLYELWEEGAIEFKSEARKCGINAGKWRFKEDAFHIARWRDAWTAWNPQVQMPLEAVR